MEASVASIFSGSSTTDKNSEIGLGQMASTAATSSRHFNLFAFHDEAKLRSSGGNSIINHTILVHAPQRRPASDLSSLVFGGGTTNFGDDGDDVDERGRVGPRQPPGKQKKLMGAAQYM